ncbi:hypothetical protein ONZ43_g6401 [Nemania bipapillata]|uniref:Uncharacterized protein n=1 Tax=Nemania bipapillata TaxID=110536 RepID=A0ACC2I180_9PEZI|nr:hypothetical protein ONZ43_g6401 [Nemania bipapillata]
MNTTTSTPAFGQATNLGVTASPWGSAGTSSSTPAFGQVGFAGTSGATPSVFGSTTLNTAASGKGFSSFASQGGFAALGSNANPDKPSIFASEKPGTADAAMDTDASTSFPPPSSKPDVSAENPFGSRPFKLASSFKPETNVDDGITKTSAGEGESIFGAGFTASINEAAKAKGSIFGGGQASFGKPSSDQTVESTTPTTTPSVNKFLSHAPLAPASSGPFSFPSASSGSIFGKVTAKASPTEPPQLQKTSPADAPLPPESTSKVTYPFEDSSSSSFSTIDITEVNDSESKAEDLPLPPRISHFKCQAKGDCSSDEQDNTP